MAELIVEAFDCLARHNTSTTRPRPTTCLWPRLVRGHDSPEATARPRPIARCPNSPKATTCQRQSRHTRGSHNLIKVVTTRLRQSRLTRGQPRWETQSQFARGSHVTHEANLGGRHNHDLPEANLTERRNCDSPEANLGRRHDFDSPDRNHDLPERRHDSPERISDSPKPDTIRLSTSLTHPGVSWVTVRRGPDRAKLFQLFST
jgi:hypothetical protein